MYDYVVVMIVLTTPIESNSRNASPADKQDVCVTQRIDMIDVHLDD